MTPVWADPQFNPPPQREQRAREALEIAVQAGVPDDELTAIFTSCGLPEVFSWPRCTDNQLAALSGKLRIAGGFY